MRITKAQLKQIIKEELEVTLTNEEAGEMFGEEVQAQLEEQELNEDDPAMLASMLDPETIEALKLIAQASMKMGKELLAPAALTLIGAAGARRGMGYRDEDPADQMTEQQGATGDASRAGKKISKASGIEAALKSINTRQEFEALMMRFIQMVSKEKLKDQDVKVGIRNVAKQVLSTNK